MFTFSRLLRPDQIKVNMKARNVEDAFDELLDVLPADRIDVKKAKKLLLERDKQSPTAIGFGVAIPHIRTKISDGAFYVAVGIAPDGIKFHSIDGETSKIVVMIIGPENATSMYLKLLAQVSTVLKDERVRAGLLAAKSNLEVIEVLLGEEEKFKPKESRRPDMGKELLILVIYQEELIEDVLSTLLSFGVHKATVLDGMGIGKAMAFGVPLFNSFRDIMQEDQPTNKTILALIDKQLVDSAVEKIEEACGAFDTKEHGFIMTVPITSLRGVNQESNRG